MKETGVSHWNSPNQGATNSSGFNGLPGGCRDADDGFFYLFGDYGSWWTTTNNGATLVYFIRLSHYNEGAFCNNNGVKSEGFSVRCIKD
jgi:uncharacterized protein (TIGR02145 family)